MRPDDVLSLLSTRVLVNPNVVYGYPEFPFHEKISRTDDLNRVNREVLYRQRALLLILQQVGGKASNSQLMKWAFLLSRETLSRGGKTFYQFIPYQYGPYSFTLARERDSLIRNGFLQVDKEKSWKLSSFGRDFQVSLPKNVTQDISSIVAKYGKFSGQQLTALAYDKYPWFTINSKLQKKEERPQGQQAIYTAGYEGKTVDEFLNLLLKSGIAGLIDVRHNPISRRYGFHKSTLARLCNFLDINYQHFPELGIPSSKRVDLSSTSQYDSLFTDYRHNLPLQENQVSHVIELIKSQPSVLVCMEADPACCHRHVLAQHLTTITNLPIKHLGYLQ